MKKRVAVIGYGGQGAWHCSKILSSDVVELAGTYDIKENRRQAAKDNGVFVYDSNEAIFADSSVDIVVVATPNDVHEDLVVNSLRSGHNVICEKPVALWGKKTSVFACTIKLFFIHLYCHIYLSNRHYI